MKNRFRVEMTNKSHTATMRQNYNVNFCNRNPTASTQLLGTTSLQDNSHGKACDRGYISYGVNPIRFQYHGKASL